MSAFLAICGSVLLIGAVTAWLDGMTVLEIVGIDKVRPSGGSLGRGGGGDGCGEAAVAGRGSGGVPVVGVAARPPVPQPRRSEQSSTAGVHPAAPPRP